jgi:hypothetical protein
LFSALLGSAVALWRLPRTPRHRQSALPRTSTRRGLRIAPARRAAGDDQRRRRRQPDVRAFDGADFVAPPSTSRLGEKVYVCLDSDKNWSTGSPGGGCDYAFAVDRSLANQVITFYAWNGTAMGELAPAKISAVGEGDTFSVSRSTSR